MQIKKNVIILKKNSFHFFLIVLWNFRYWIVFVTRLIQITVWNKYFIYKHF